MKKQFINSALIEKSKSHVRQFCAKSIYLICFMFILCLPGSAFATHDPAPVSDVDYQGMGTFTGSYSHSSTDHVWFVFNAKVGDVINFSVTTPGWQSFCWLYSAPDNCVEIGDFSDDGTLNNFQAAGPGTSTYTFSFTASTAQYAMQLDSYLGGSGNYTVIISGSTVSTTLCCHPTITCPANISLNSDPDLCSAIYNFPDDLVLQYNPTGSLCGNTPIAPSNQGLGFTAGNLTTVGLLDWCNTGTLPIGKITASPTVPAGEYLTFTVSVPGGTRFAKLNYDKTSYLGTGPTKASIRSSLDAYSSDISMISVNPGGSQSLEFNLSGMGPVSGSITFRIYFYGATVDYTDWADLDGTDRGKKGIRLFAFSIASAVDCYGNVPDIQYTNISPSSTYPVGTTTITALATEQNGGIASCKFKIIVTDAQAPNITKCPDNRTFSGCNTGVINSPAYNENETNSSFAAYSSSPNNGTAYDNCGITGVTYKDSKSGTCPIVVTRSWKVKDNAGNNKTCNQQISINAPLVVITECPQNKNEGLCQTQEAINNSYSNWLNSIIFSGGCNAVASNNGGAAPSRYGGSKTVTFTVTSSCEGPVTCSAVFTVSGPDDDCDGVGNACDQCPGGDDKIDNNNDGKPDCKYPPSNINQIINAWKCSANTKVQVCSKSPGGYKTVCTYLSAVQNHIIAGGYLGPCGNSGCGGGNLKRIEKNEFMTGEEVLYQYDLTASDYQGIEVYPNPAQNILYVKVQSNTGNPVDLVLYNSFGQKLLVEKHVMNNQLELVIPIGITDYSNGLYFVKVMNGLEQNVKSFTIQK